MYMTPSHLRSEFAVKLDPYAHKHFNMFKENLKDNFKRYALKYLESPAGKAWLAAIAASKNGAMSVQGPIHPIHLQEFMGKPGIKFTKLDLIECYKKILLAVDRVSLPDHIEDPEHIYITWASQDIHYTWLQSLSDFALICILQWVQLEGPRPKGHKHDANTFNKLFNSHLFDFGAYEELEFNIDPDQPPHTEDDGDGTGNRKTDFTYINRYEPYDEDCMAMEAVDREDEDHEMAMEDDSSAQSSPPSRFPPAVEEPVDYGKMMEIMDEDVPTNQFVAPIPADLEKDDELLRRDPSLRAKIVAVNREGPQVEVEALIESLNENKVVFNPTRLINSGLTVPTYPAPEGSRQLARMFGDSNIHGQMFIQTELINNHINYLLLDIQSKQAEVKKFEDMNKKLQENVNHLESLARARHCWALNLEELTQENKELAEKKARMEFEKSTFRAVPAYQPDTRGSASRRFQPPSLPTRPPKGAASQAPPTPKSQASNTGISGNFSQVDLTNDGDYIGGAGEDTEADN